MPEDDIVPPNAVTRLVEDTARGDELAVTRNDAPVAVIVGWDRWCDLQSDLQERSTG